MRLLLSRRAERYGEYFVRGRGGYLRELLHERPERYRAAMENAVTNGPPGEGFFANEVFRDIWFHTSDQGAGVFHMISNDNFFFLDEAKFAIAIEPPWSWGRITWQIPISWAAREARHEIEIMGVLPICYTQKFEIFESGRFRLSKHGYWVERHADGSRSRSQGVLYQ